MWMTEENSSFKIKLIDWEMVGIGSGPQELGQYIISHMDPMERKLFERELVERRTSKEKCCSWEFCWEEYKIGGVERWIWFLVYFIDLRL